MPAVLANTGDYRMVFEVVPGEVAPYMVAAQIALVAVLVGTVAFFVYSLRIRSRARQLLSVGILLINLSAVAVFRGFDDDRERCQQWMQNNDYRIAEGRVYRYHPMPEHGHDTEMFEVAGTEFEFPWGGSKTAGRCGFTQHRQSGSPIRERARVRIRHHEGSILSLEIDERDFPDDIVKPKKPKILRALPLLLIPLILYAAWRSYRRYAEKRAFWRAVVTDVRVRSGWWLKSGKFSPTTTVSFERDDGSRDKVSFPQKQPPPGLDGVKIGDRLVKEPDEMLPSIERESQR